MAKKAKTKAGAADAAGEGDGKASAPKNKKMLFIAGGGFLALLLVAGGAAYFLGLFGGEKPKGERETAEHASPHGAPPAHGEQPAPVAERPKLPQFMDLPEITVNLSGSTGKAQYLRVKVSLEIADASVATQIQPMLPRVLDTFQVFLREMRSSDLDGSAAVFRLKEELGRRANLAVQPAKIEAVLFRDLLVQ